ncbi:hypothetical protein [Sutcliffiella halmapala]|uniref:hypothetical protein n=1 Tax=Sutcliffiella halmapala TaxID=79882 RepID=UPI0009951EEF|nr:hypothetical protein [Sutcliffiella halmapala]
MFKLDKMQQRTISVWNKIHQAHKELNIYRESEGLPVISLDEFEKRVINRIEVSVMTAEQAIDYELFAASGGLQKSLADLEDRFSFVAGEFFKLFYSIRDRVCAIWNNIKPLYHNSVLIDKELKASKKIARQKFFRKKKSQRKKWQKHKRKLGK